MTKKTKITLEQIVIICVLIIVFVVTNIKIFRNRLYKVTPKEDNINIAYQIDSISVEDNQLEVTGWICELEKVKNVTRSTCRNSLLSIVLIDRNYSSEQKTDGIPMTVKRCKRNDVNDYFQCEYDYSDSGFIAKVDLSKIDLYNTTYEIVAKLNSKETDGIKLNAFISNGELKYVDPANEMNLDVEGTDLESIVREGICLVSRNDIHCSIYQYGWKLYWIVDNDFYLKQTGSTYLEYMTYTASFDKLPKERTINGWYFDNIGSTFEKNEVTNSMNCGKYRVSVRTIPEEYPITSMELGYYESGEWVWRALIRPHYDFD